jgi:NADPH:quinone reductase-like Zn-dependent oxidoreductase
MAEYMAVKARYVFPKPTNLNWEETAAFPLAALTAFHMLIDKAALTSGQWVLVYGASSGVGSAAIQIAKTMNAKVITTVGSKEKFVLAQQLGADHIINYREQPIGKTVREITKGQGVDIVFEHTGQKTWNDSLRALKYGGKIVTCGATTGPLVKIDLRPLFIKHQQIIGSTMGTLQNMSAVLELINNEKLKPVVDKIYPIEEIKLAHQRLETGDQFGKIVMRF